MKDIVKKFKALSDETRLRIMNVLLERECCVCEVMQALDISQTRASRNLNILYDAGFLKARRNGLWVLYSIDKDNLEESYASLTEIINTNLKLNKTAVKDKRRLAKATRPDFVCTSNPSNN